MAISRRSATTGTSTPALTLWISRGLEALWLMAVVLVTLAYFSPEWFLSEAVIAYVQVPKLALLRTLVALMAVLWLLEWGLVGRMPLASYVRNQGFQLAPRVWVSALAGWLRDQPTRWVVLAVWLVLGSTLLSTVLSASFSVSMWGEVPGQDGPAAYNTIAYVLLFGVMVTHLKTPAQLWRLLGAVVLVGVLVSGYAVLQHYGHDFLGLLESTGGGGTGRITAIMGNAVFAGAAILVPIGVSLLLAAVSLSKLVGNHRISGKTFGKIMVLVLLGTWALALAVQFLGLIFTFSRGPWMGAIVAVAGFLALAALFVGWRAWGWAAPVLGLAAAIAWWVLQGWSPGFGAGPWASVLVALAGVLALACICWVLVPSILTGRRLKTIPQMSTISRPVLAAGAAVGLGLAGVAAVAVIIAYPYFYGDGLGPGIGTSAPSRSTSAVQQRFASITDEVISGGFSRRGLHWQDSWRVGRDRPWFEFDTLSLPWLRPIIGYGPEMFRYTYLLESTPQGGNLLPTEPDHAHNFFIHQWVEQGILGLFSSLALFGAVFAVGGYLLLRHRADYSDVHKLVIVGLLAVVAGRFVEQIVGLARASDLTLFWALLAAFVALPGVMRPPGAPEPAAPRQKSPAAQRRERQRSRSRPTTQSADWQRLVMLALVAWAIGGIFAVTWVKTINYPRAGLIASDAVDRFHRGDFQGAVAGLDRAIALAPDVPVYYTFKASVLAAYLQDGDVPPHPECSRATDGTPYDLCLGRLIFLSNLAAVQQRPYYWRSRLALANSALALGLNDEAIRLYREVVDLVPHSWPLYNRLAEAYIDVGQPEMALGVLEESLAITQTSSSSNEARRLQTLASEKLSNLEDSTAPAVP